MSYILDALKKSSEERRRLQEEEAQQDTLPLSSQAAQKTHGQNRLLMILLVVSILTLPAAGWWYFSSTEISNRDLSHRVPANTPESEEDPGEPSTAGPEPVSAAKPAPEKITNAPGKSLEKPEETSAETKRPLMQELPLALRAQLPEMKFSGHVFSPAPELRMIMINTSVVREGDLIDADLRLMEITSDGLVMSHKGTEFIVVLF